MDYARLILDIIIMFFIIKFIIKLCNMFSFFKTQQRINNWISGPLNLFSLELTEIPDNLPQSLQELSLGANQITEIPYNLPQGLLYLYLSNNKITEIPYNLPQSLQ